MRMDDFSSSGGGGMNFGGAQGYGRTSYPCLRQHTTWGCGQHNCPATFNNLNDLGRHIQLGRSLQDQYPPHHSSFLPQSQPVPVNEGSSANTPYGNLLGYSSSMPSDQYTNPPAKPGPAYGNLHHTGQYPMNPYTGPSHGNSPYAIPATQPLFSGTAPQPYSTSYTMPFPQPAFGGHNVPQPAFGGHNVPQPAFGGHNVPPTQSGFPSVDLRASSENVQRPAIMFHCPYCPVEFDDQTAGDKHVIKDHEDRPETAKQRVKAYYSLNRSNMPSISKSGMEFMCPLRRHKDYGCKTLPAASQTSLVAHLQSNKKHASHPKIVQITKAYQYDLRPEPGEDVKDFNERATRYIEDL